jgi:hypothetical protein
MIPIHIPPAAPSGAVLHISRSFGPANPRRRRHRAFVKRNIEAKAAQELGRPTNLVYKEKKKRPGTMAAEPGRPINLVDKVDKEKKKKTARMALGLGRLINLVDKEKKTKLEKAADELGRVTNLEDKEKNRPKEARWLIPLSSRASIKSGQRRSVQGFAKPYVPIPLSIRLKF